MAEKIKALNIEIVVHGTTEKPYYEISYYDVVEKCTHVGFSSYNLDYVFKWKKEFFIDL